MVISAESDREMGVAVPANDRGSILKMHIGEGKDINLEISATAFESENLSASMEKINPIKVESIAENTDNLMEDKAIRSLTRKHFKVTEVRRGAKTKLEGTILYIREGIEKDAVLSQELVHDLSMEIITPDRYHEYSETIMDVQPIATKEGDAVIGTGVTRVLDGVIMMVTGTDVNGVQIGEFGTSNGKLDEHIVFGRPGCPDYGEIFIKTQVTIAAGKNMERPGPIAAHSATDVITQEIREALKIADESLVVEEEIIEQKRRPGRKKVVLVKEIMGQGAMHDNFILPNEPVGVLGAKPNVDLGNVPIVVNPLEVLDGCIHALTCIGPSTKEVSRHYWREPLVKMLMEDTELDLAGIIFVGSPQVNSEKFYVSRRVGQTVECMDVDGAIVGTEGEGNNHIDFASHIEQIGMRGIPVVGVTFSAKTGALVVGNKYMTHMIELAKCEDGLDNTCLGNNTITAMDAIRIIAMLKNAMMGIKVKAPERHWKPYNQEENLEAIESVTGEKIEREPNEITMMENAAKEDK